MLTLAQGRLVDEGKRRRTKVIRPASFSPRVILSGLAELIDYSDLLLTLTLHRVKVRYKQSVLGFAWAILQPVLLMAIYTIVFRVIARMPSGGTPYVVFVYAALLPWTFFSTSVTTAASSLVTHNNLITKVYFPREILPATYVMAALFDFIMASGVLLVLLAAYHLPLGSSALVAIPIMCAAFIFSLSVSMLLSAFQVRFRDIGIALTLIMQLWMYATPVVYPLSIIPQQFRWVYALNPMAGIVENFRRAVLGGASLDLQILMPGVLVCCLLLPVAYLYFKTAEATMADVI
jgi:lipopolysaccharide transport system permease protein